MSTYTITINFNFPDGVSTNTPTVTTSTTQTDTVASTYDSVTWAVRANITDMDGLFIDDITFYSDSGKTRRVDPDCLDAGTWDSATNTYTMDFNSTDTASLQTYYYKIFYRDDDMTADATWDPTLKIQPRTNAEPPNAQEQGG